MGVTYRTVCQTFAAKSNFFSLSIYNAHSHACQTNIHAIQYDLWPGFERYCISWPLHLLIPVDSCPAMTDGCSSLWGKFLWCHLLIFFLKEVYYTRMTKTGHIQTFYKGFVFNIHRLFPKCNEKISLPAQYRKMYSNTCSTISKDLKRGTCNESKTDRRKAFLKLVCEFLRLLGLVYSFMLLVIELCNRTKQKNVILFFPQTRHIKM